MQLRYDEDFIEGAVFVCANSRSLSPPALQARRFHRAREKCYEILDPDERNTAFFEVHLEWFREWGLEKTLVGVLTGFPLLPSVLKALVFRKARLKSEEGAELYVNGETGHAGVVALCVERFEQPLDLEHFLAHEFTHLHDMVDPAFGYSPQLHLPGQNVAQQRLTRERYRLLWDITIDGRLSASSSPGIITGRDQHRLAFDRAFNFWPEARLDHVFIGLWENRQPTHDELLALASDPRELQSSSEPGPGAPCPLCGFTTFAWADAHELSGSILKGIQREFPDWLPAHGACRRCAEIYRRAPLPILVTDH